MSFKTVIEYPKEIEEKLKKICEDIKVTSGKKGEEFNFKFEDDKLIIISDRMKRAYARGFWIKQSGIYVDDFDKEDRDKVRENRRLRRKIRFTVVKNV